MGVFVLVLGFTCNRCQSPLPRTRLCPRHRQLFEQSAELHDKRDFARGENLTDADRRYERHRDEHICLYVKRRDQPYNRLEDNGQTAQDNCDPRHVKRKRFNFKQTANDGGAGYHKERDILFYSAEPQQPLRLFCYPFHIYIPFYTIGGMPIVCT